MNNNIKKTATEIDNYKNKIIFYKSARNGFSAILKFLKNRYKDFTLLLPGYIGYSPREGSGIYDPIIENDVNHIFYPVDENINVEIEKYEDIVNSITNKIVVLIVHYFGYIDSNINKIVEIAKNKNAFIIEDCAHALYTDYIDNSCGNFSDVSIYSLHKMLPYPEGGMVRINNSEQIMLEETNYNYNLLEYNLKEIAKKRKENARIIENELSTYKGIRILRKVNKYKNQTPQTYPIIIEKKDKNEMYHNLNEKGFGVISLYHTMIEPLRNRKYEKVNLIAKKILNLPVHQDANKQDIVNMCKLIKKSLGESNGR